MDTPDVQLSKIGKRTFLLAPILGLAHQKLVFLHSRILGTVFAFTKNHDLGGEVIKQCGNCRLSLLLKKLPVFLKSHTIDSYKNLIINNVIIIVVLVPIV